MSKITVEGVDEFVEFLEHAASLSEVKKVVKHHGANLQKTMQRKAVFRGHWTGSINNRRFVKPTGNLKRMIQAPVASEGGMTSTVTAAAEYSAYVELGTRFMEAQPYTQPALDEVGPRFLSDIAKVVIK